MYPYMLYVDKGLKRNIVDREKFGLLIMWNVRVEGYIYPPLTRLSQMSYVQKVPRAILINEKIYSTERDVWCNVKKTSQSWISIASYRSPRLKKLIPRAPLWHAPCKIEKEPNKRSKTSKLGFVVVQFYIFLRSSNYDWFVFSSAFTFWFNFSNFVLG